MKYPGIRLEGTDLLRRAGVSYAQILNDLVMKVDKGDSFYPRGFLHTSTTNLMTPSYYPSMWSRDAGRGIMELSRAGFTDLAGMVVDYIVRKGPDVGDHYGRAISWYDEEKQEEMVFDVSADQAYEADGNVNLLLGIYTYWKYSGSDKVKGVDYIKNAMSIFDWFERLGNDCPYGFLLASASELSGNPFGNFIVYAIYATYGAVCVLDAYGEMAKVCGDTAAESRFSELSKKFRDGILTALVSRGAEGGQQTKTPAGVWLNGLDRDSGLAAEVGDFGPKFPIHRWTRQLPFVLDYDSINTFDKDIDKVNNATYEYIKDGMAEGYYFRKYGFVSCTCFTGMGDRHDDTMAGYGQNLFTQAALLRDDVNVYTKCIDGMMRLVYDGDIVKPMTPDLNPWVMHECFNYDNYEKGFDHTFGCIGDDSREIMHNPGDEGNLVQSSETLKTFSIMAGVDSKDNCLIIKPRLPWECTEAEVVDMPVILPDKSMGRVSYLYNLTRWQNRFKIRIKGTSAFDRVLVRIGPLPYVLCNEEELKKEWTIKRTYQASFAEKIIDTNGRDEVEAELINQL